jgi:3-oxoacyl-[acyl-carrier-protein] synthase II
MGGLCPLGTDWEQVSAAIHAGKSGVQHMPEWESVQGMRTKLGAPVPGFETPDHYNRKKLRTMGRVSILAVRATELALEDAGLLGSDVVKSPSTGVSYGSTYGSPPAFEKFAQAGLSKNMDGVSGSSYIQFMSHTAAANVAQFFETQGRIIPTCCACTAGSQGIGYAYEAIVDGRQDVMLGGGSEELHYFSAAVFDIMFATSTRNDAPQSVPRPFDASRDGLVVGEGAGTLVLESLEHAQARGARIHAEIIGYATNCDGNHIVHPSTEGMERVMRGALKDAGIGPDDVDYVNLHGTATEIGDINESQATWNCFGRAVPASSLKSFMGHTLGACGSIEAWICIRAMQEGWVPPTLHLNDVDPRCAPLDYVREVRKMPLDIVMSNNFAFGGVNTSLLFRRWNEG